MTRLSKDGNAMGIWTDQSDVAFTDELAWCLARLIDSGMFDYDWTFQLEGWIGAAADLLRTRENASPSFDPDYIVIETPKGEPE